MVGLALIDSPVAPAPLMVTSTAVTPETAAVNIVEVMASRAGGSLAHGPRARALMAGEAVEPLVTPLKRKIRVAAMVETPARPAIRVVAASAILTQLLLVWVIGCVAANATWIRIAEAHRSVTGLA